MYAIAFIALVFLVPGAILGVWGWWMDAVAYKYEITARGWATSFAVLGAVYVTWFVTVMAIPKPFPGA